MRRIRSIALVHEILSHEAGDDVPFIEIVRPLVRMVEEGLLSPDHPVDFKVTGDAGKLPATIATPLAVVLNELLQNVVDHAYPDRGRRPTGGHVAARARQRRRRAAGRGSPTTGPGCPTGSRSTRPPGSGLSIVRTLVTTELDGTIELVPGRARATGPGTVVDVAGAARRRHRARSVRGSTTVALGRVTAPRGGGPVSDAA